MRNSKNLLILDKVNDVRLVSAEMVVLSIKVFDSKAMRSLKVCVSKWIWILTLVENLKFQCQLKLCLSVYQSSGFSWNCGIHNRELCKTMKFLEVRNLEGLNMFGSKDSISVDVWYCFQNSFWKLIGIWWFGDPREYMSYIQQSRQVLSNVFT
jgi:hypothetical protein